jgi:hypothetical protein
MTVKCYFYARSHRPEPHCKGPGIIAFCIPDLGFAYRAALRATPSEFAYRALTALLRFLESNPKVINRQKLQLLTDCAPLIYQVRGDMVAPLSVREALGTIRLKKRQLGFTLNWVSEEDNRARENIVLQPITRTAPKLNFSSLQDASFVQRVAGWPGKSQRSQRPKV